MSRSDILQRFSAKGDPKHVPLMAQNTMSSASRSTSVHQNQHPFASAKASRETYDTRHAKMQDLLAAVTAVLSKDLPDILENIHSSRDWPVVGKSGFRVWHVALEGERYALPPTQAPGAGEAQSERDEYAEMVAEISTATIRQGLVDQQQGEQQQRRLQLWSTRPKLPAEQQQRQSLLLVPAMWMEKAAQAVRQLSTPGKRPLDPAGVSVAVHRLRSLIGGIEIVVFYQPTPGAGPAMRSYTQVL